MARKSGKGARSVRKMIDAGMRLAAMSGLLLLLPFALEKSPIRQALESLRVLGAMALLFGTALLLVGRALGKKAEARDAPARADQAKTTETPHPRPERWSKAVFEVIEWRRFEALVERLFQQAGFETRSESHGTDGGIDVWLHFRNRLAPPVGLVQCKHWQGKRVGVDKVRELRGVMAAHGVRRGQFATTSTFTEEAATFARENGIHLLDADGLLDLIGTRPPEQQAELLAVALDGEYWRPTCVNCGIKMRERRPRDGGTPFWGCVNFPKCRTTMLIRAA